MGVFSDWIKNIIYYIILLKIINGILPEEKRGGFYKLVTGILLILLIIKPVIGWMNSDYSSKTFDLGELITNKTIEVETASSMNKKDDLTLTIFENNIRDTIESVVSGEGMHLISAYIDMEKDTDNEDFGKIRSIRIKIKPEENISNDISDDALKNSAIKSKLTDFYNVDEDNIYINIDSN